MDLNKRSLLILYTLHVNITIQKFKSATTKWVGT